MFVTSVTLYFGPRFFPSAIEPVPKEWSLVVVGVMVFSASLLLFWGTAAGWRILTRGAGVASKALAASSLSQQEQGLLAAMGFDPNQPLNIDNVDYAKAPFTKLELIEIAHELSRKGLVHLNPYDNSLEVIRKLCLSSNSPCGTR